MLGTEKLPVEPAESTKALHWGCFCDFCVLRGAFLGAVVLEYPSTWVWLNITVLEYTCTAPVCVLSSAIPVDGHDCELLELAFGRTRINSGGGFTSSQSWLLLPAMRLVCRFLLRPT